MNRIYVWLCPHCGTTSNALVHCVVRNDGTKIEVGNLFAAERSKTRHESEGSFHLSAGPGQ
jgi:hypothetical protein